MENATKIQHLKSGINLDTGLEYTITTARKNKLAQGKFQSYVLLMAAEIDVKTQRLKQLSSSRSRMIARLQGGFRWGSRGGDRGGRGDKGRGFQSSTSDIGPVLKATVNEYAAESRRYAYQESNQLNQN